MANRIFIGLALLCLCLTSVYGGATLSSDAVIISDKMDDKATTRDIVVGLTITASTSDNSEVPRVCTSSVTGVTATPGVVTVVDGSATPHLAGSTSACTNDDADCVYPVTVTFSFDSAYCAQNPGQFSIDYALTYDLCDGSSSEETENVIIQLKDRDVCSNSQAIVSAAIVGDGPYANSGFTISKNPYLVGDVVYFPFKVTYTGLSIANVAFSSIGVTEGSSSPVYLYDSVAQAPTAAGSAVQLATESVSQLNSGTATAWFSIKITRDAQSPFVGALNPDTLYTFDVVFDVVYKNAKRNLEGREEGTRMTSRAYLRVSDQEELSEPSEVIVESLPMESAGYTVQVGLVVVLFSIMLALF